MTRQRIKYAFLGLTQSGTVRVNERHPELAGLGRAEYHKRYMRRVRMREKAERIRNK